MEISTGLRGLRRQVAGFSLAMLMASFFAINVAQAATFTDVQPSDWFYPYVEQLAADGILNTSFSRFRPADFAKRDEAAKLLVEAFDIPLENPDVPTFKDVGKGDWSYQYVEAAVKNGFINGYKDNTGVLTGFFGPGDNVTREQFMKMCVLAAPLTTNIQGGPHFPDVTQNMWSYEFVETGYNWSVIDGHPDGTFRPGNNIDRAAIAKITANCMAPVLRPGAGFNVEDVSALSLTSVEVCFTEEPGTGAEDPDNYMIKDADGEELAVTDAVRSTDPMCVKLTTEAQEPGRNYELTASGIKSESGEDLDIPDAPFSGFSAVGTGGDLTCTEGDMPPAATVPKGSTGVLVAEVNCSAAADPVVVTGMTFHRFGAGDESDIADVYLYRDNYRLTNGRSINSENQEVQFNGLNTTIEANETVSFQLYVDIDLGAGANNHHGFELVNEDNVMSNADSTAGDFPIKSNEFEIAGFTAGTVNIEANGSLDELTIGETGRIAQFEVELGSSEGGDLEQIALYLRGTCDSSDISDLKLYVEGSTEVLASVDSVGAKDLATFVLEDPYHIDQGENVIMFVEGKVACRNGEFIRTFIDETTDVHVRGITSQFGLRVDISKPFPGNYDGNINAPFGYSEVLVKGTEFNVAFNGPAAGDIAIGQDAASCLDMTITNASTEDITIEDWEVTLAMQGPLASPAAGGLLDTSVAGTTSANYTLVKLVGVNPDDANDKITLGPGELSTAAGASDTVQAVELSGSPIIEGGTTYNAKIVFDVANQPLMTGDKIRCTLTNLTTSGRNFVQDINGDEMGPESVTPSSAITGNTQTVSAAGLTFEVSGTPSSRTYVSGTQKANLVGFTVRSGSSISNTIKSITVQGYVDCNTNGLFSSTGTAVAPGCGDNTSTILKDTVDNMMLVWNTTDTAQNTCIEDEDNDNGPCDVKVSDVENVNLDGRIIFNNLTIPVPMSTTITLSLRGNVNQAAPYGTFNDRVKFGIAASTDVIAIDQNSQNVSSGGINVNNAANGCPGVPGICVANAGTIMTISRGGFGSIDEQGSPQQTLMVGNSPETLLAKWKFTSEDQDVSLRDITIGTLNRNGASIDYIKLFTGSNCDVPVKILGGADSGQQKSTGNTGVFFIEGLDLTITDAGDTMLCAKGKTPSVAASGDPVSGDHVGLVLLDIPEIIGGSGSNVSDLYVGKDAVPATPIVKDPEGFLDVDLDIVVGSILDTTSVDSLGLAAAAVGNVIVIDQEQMLIVQHTDGTDDYAVLRGYAKSTIAAHSAQETGVADVADDGSGINAIYYSSLASLNTTILNAPSSTTDTCFALASNLNISQGDAISAVDNIPLGIEYMVVRKVLATAADVTFAGTLDPNCGAPVMGDVWVYRGAFGSTALTPPTTFAVTEFTERGPFDPLHASVPMITAPNQTPAQNTAGGTLTLLRFDIEGKGENNVIFQDNMPLGAVYGVEDDVIQVHLSGINYLVNPAGCTLFNTTNSETLDIVPGPFAGNKVLNFNMSTNDLIVSPGNKATLEVRCDVAGIAFSTSLSAQINEAVSGDPDPEAAAIQPIVPVIYSDSTTEGAIIAEPGSLVDNLPIIGNSFSNS